MAVKANWVAGEDYLHTDQNAIATLTNTNETSLLTKAATNTATSVDNEVALFSSTTGKMLKRATGTGLAKLTSGVLSTATAGTDFHAPGGTDIPVADGGTGASTAAAARTNLEVPAAATTIATTNSLTGGGDLSANRTLSLVNDTASPGNSKYYGTNGSGTRGYFDLPAGGGGSGDVTTNTATSVDGEVVLFNGTTGKSLKRATATGLAKLTAGVLSAATAGVDYITPSGADAIINKTINVDSNTVSNIEVDNFKASAVVIASEGLNSSNNDTSFATVAAIKGYVDTLLASTPRFLVYSAGWPDRPDDDRRTFFLGGATATDAPTDTHLRTFDVWIPAT